MKTEPLDFADLKQVANGEWVGLPAKTVKATSIYMWQICKKLQEFYTALGYEVVLRYGVQALFISTGKYHHHIGLNTWHGENAPQPAANQVGLQSFTVQLNEKDQEVIARLEKIGASVEKTATGFITADSSGNRILVEQ